MNELRQLTEYLQRLRPDGPAGLEGLVAQLLERLTGHRFFLAHAGSQAGLDIGTGGFGGTGIAVEAKRFRSSKRFDQRALLGELVEVARDPGLDLWVLVSTARVPNQIISKLREEAASRGIEVETLDSPPDRLGDLLALCAAHADTVLSFLSEDGADGNPRQLLEAIRHHPDFAQVLERIGERFRASSIGYAQARSGSLTYLRSAFGDARQARVELGQPINVMENGGRHVVERRQVLEALESWWRNWPATPRPFVLLGEEGMGKTWAIASWLARRLSTPDPALPLTLFLPSSAVGTSRALDLIAEALATCTGVRDGKFWSRRAQAFAERSQASRPALLLVLDGLNEQPLFDWRTLLESLHMSPWKDQVAIVLTCRPSHWRENLAPAFQGTFQVFEVGPYDDCELASALEKGGLRTIDLPSSLEPLLRRPRYLDLTVRHRTALEQSGDVTVDRLLYEDWKDRASRKRGLFSDQDFRALLARLAKEHRDSQLSKRDVQDLLPASGEHFIGLDEIITGGILIRDSLGRFTVEPRRLVQGLGLLLADQVRSVSGQGDSAMREELASFLEPHADLDRKVAVCRSAVTFAILEPDFPEAARSVLLEQWVGSRNLSREDIESFTAYLPASTAAYLRLVEHFWTMRRTNHQAKGLLAQAFFRWRDNSRVQQAVTGACEKWLSYVHPYGYRFMRGRDDQSRAELRREIEERAGQPLRPGTKFLLVDELKVTENDGCLWLAEPALLLASLFPIEPLIPALRRWALSRSVIGHPEEIEAVAWVLRWSGEDLWPALKTAVTPLLEGSRVAQQAAWRLLWACGREEAGPLFERLPENLYPPSPYEELYAEDPCLSFWRREDCAMCASRPDLPDRLVALKLAPYATDPDLRIELDLRPRLRGALASIRADQSFAGIETTVDDSDLREMEPTLAAFAPDLLAETYRTLVRNLPNRRGRDREFLLSELGALTLLLEGQREQHVLRETWERVCRTETWNDDTVFAESRLFGTLLFHASAGAQLDLLLRRPEQAYDDAKRLRFKRLPARYVRALAQGLLASTPRELQRKLWFLWYQSAAPAVEVLGAERLVDLLDHADRETAAIAEQWIFLFGSTEALDLAIERGKLTPASTRSYYWFTAKIRSRHPYAMLARAIDLGGLSYVVRERPRDLASYTRDLDRAVRAAVSVRDENLNTDFCQQTLKAIVRQDRKIVEGWVLLAVEQRDIWSPLIESCHRLFEPLCEILLAEDPPQGVELFQTLMAQRRRARTFYEDTSIDVLALTLFRVRWSESTEALLRQWLDTCITDENLFELALAASAAHDIERLAKIIRQDLSSPVPVKRAAALTLAGFSPYGSPAATLLESIQLHPEGWLHEVRNRAQRHLDRDRWAQEWFRRFAASPDPEGAFAAFQLFLRCADRRYWTWREELLERVHPKQDRRRYLEFNRDRLDRAIEENERDLKKRFLGRGIPEYKVRPWLASYFGMPVTEVVRGKRER